MTTLYKWKLVLNTPKGLAEKTGKKFKTMLIGFKKPFKVDINKRNSRITWHLELSLKQALKIQRNVTIFSGVATATLDHKLTKKAVKMIDKSAGEDTTPETYEEVKRMLNETRLHFGRQKH